MSALDTFGDSEPRPRAPQRFRDRQDAGGALGRRLVRYAGRADAVVVGLAPGGLIVADVVARELRLPLVEWSVRALGVPGDERLSVGAIAGSGMVVLDPAMIGAHGMSDAAVDQAILAARDALGSPAQPRDPPFHAAEQAYDALPRATDDDVRRVLARRATEPRADHAAQDEPRPPA